MPPLYLVDGHSQMFRAFYAVRRLSNASGLPTNMIFGFVQILQRLLKEYNPERLVVTFDLPVPTFRHQLYPEYKANRPPAPEDFGVQVPYVKALLEAFGVPIVQREGFEADDVIGTLARQASQAGDEVFILSSDKDLFQLIDERVKLINMKGSRIEVVDRERVREKLGVWPEQMLDYLGMAGDSVDNIPGIPGVGPKTGAKLLEQFGSMDAMYERLEEIPSAKQREKIEAHRQDAILSRELATLKTDMDLGLSPAELERREENPAQLARLFDELQFREYQRKYPLPEQPPAGPALSDPQPADAPSTTSPPDKIVRRYETITEEEDLARWAQRLAQAELVAFDTETDGLDTLRAGLVGISLSDRPGEAIYIPIAHATLAEPQLPLSLIQEQLGPMLADARVAKAAHHAKFDLAMLERHGLPVAGLKFDTMLAAYLLDPDGSCGLKKVALARLDIRMTEISELIGSGRNQIAMSEVSIEQAAPYAAMDADVTLRLARLFEGELADTPLAAVFGDIEMPLIHVLLRMEQAGIAIDRQYLAELSTKFERQLEGLAKRIYECSGRSFLINSPKQVAEILFDDLGLPTTNVRRGKSGALSTDVSVLEMLAPQHPLPQLLLEYRQFEKLKSTYVDPLPTLLNPETCRIHSSFNQTMAATGRLSSSRPNLQNIPIRTSEGRAIRRGFIPAQAGWLFLAADYSQIELRLLAHVSGDHSLVHAFRNNIDIHRLTAAKVFGIEPADVTSEMRSQAKVVNFGIIYGMSAHRLSGELGISRVKAQQFIDEYFAAYPGVREWTEKIIEQTRERGYVETLSGRRRYVRDINSRNFNARGAAERIAVNTPIQGSAADMIKLAMIEMDRQLRERQCRAKMILQVHDELIFDLPPDELEPLEPVIRQVMEQAMPLDVPVIVELKSGHNWEEC
ncbi:DNA polymerase I [Candidatus Sumerlaeota bacterium]